MSAQNFNLDDMMKNAKDLLSTTQEQLSKVTAVGEAGAGLVKVLLNGKHEVIELTLADELMQEPKEVIQELISAAINDGNRKVTKAAQENIMSLSKILK